MKNLLSVLITLIIMIVKVDYSLAAAHLPLRKKVEEVNKKYKTNDLFKSYLQLISFKHKVLSQNLANINTPAYKADEVEIPTNYNNLVASNSILKHKVKMACTSDKHIAGSIRAETQFTSKKLKDSYETKMNGNNVSLAQQTTKLSQNKNDYLASVKAYSTTNALFSSVLGK